MIHKRMILGAATLISAMTASGNGLQPELWGKVDVAPVYVHLDILESGHTIKNHNMGGVKADATVGFFSDMGWVIKPTALYATTCSHSQLFTGGAYFGHVTPICKGLYLTPLLGCMYTYMDTRIQIPFFGDTNLKERFYSVSPCVGLEGIYSFTPNFRICALYQYSWSRTKTRISTPIATIKDTSHTEGSSYSAMLEYDLNDCWSVNIGGAYNISLTKERHGLRGAGAKLGVAYWF